MLLVYPQVRDQRQMIVIKAGLSVCKFSLHYPHKMGCLVMRIKQMIIHSI